MRGLLVAFALIAFMLAIPAAAAIKRAPSLEQRAAAMQHTLKHDRQVFRWMRKHHVKLVAHPRKGSVQAAYKAYRRQFRIVSRKLTHVRELIRQRNKRLASLHAAAEAAAEARRRAAQLRQLNSGTPRQIAYAIIAQRGLQSSWSCFDYIISHESSWNPYATNGSSGAYGLPQALPGWKMATHGSDWRSSPATQTRWAIDYMQGRYGSVCGAYYFWLNHRWY